MCKGCCFVLLAAWGLSASGQTTLVTASAQQAIDKIGATLVALRNQTLPSDSVTRQLADSMMALETGAHRPEQSDVLGFAAELTVGLLGRTFNDNQAATLRQNLTDVVRGTGISNFALAQRLRETLTAIQVDDPKTDIIIRRFLAIGEAVRGPDDSPLRAVKIPKK